MTSESTLDVRVGICGIDSIYTQGLESLLTKIAGFSPVAVCNTQAEMVAMAAQRRPEIIMVKEWEEPDDFVYVIQRIREVHRQVKLLVLVTNAKCQKTLLRICETRPDAVVESLSGLTAVNNVLQSLIRGETYLSPDVTRTLMQCMADLLGHVKSRHGLHNMELLTNREKDVYALMKKGWKNREIAGQLYISINTVQNHIVSINKKLKLHGKREIAEVKPNIQTGAPESTVVAGKADDRSPLDAVCRQMTAPDRTWLFDERFLPRKH